MDSANSKLTQTRTKEQLVAEMLHLRDALSNLSLAMKDLICEADRVYSTTDTTADTAAVLKKIAER
jgi:hypothetical protein